MAKILCVGILVSDTIVKPVHPDAFLHDTVRVDDVEQSTGGDAMNQALVLRRLGNHVALAGIVGQDARGAELVETLRREGVDTRHMHTSASAGTSTSILLCEASGERHVLYYPGAVEEFYMPSLEALEDYDILSVGSLFAVPRMDREGYRLLLPEAKRLGLTVVADLTANVYGVKREDITRLFPYIDCLCPSLVEGEMLTGERTPQAIISALWAMGARTVVLKAGEDGCYLGSGDITHIPAYRDVPVVDTTGAGDSFVAGFVHALGKGLDHTQGARFASAVGAVSVGALGATTAVTSEEQILRFAKSKEEP